MQNTAPIPSFDTHSPLSGLSEEVRNASGWVAPLRAEIGRVVVGQAALVDRLLVALLTQGHVLLEGVPGLAKTLTLKSLAKALQADFKRIQFTPDMLPADVVGTEIYVPQTGAFATKKGPVFANLVLADEINRAPAKVQSALLEAMAERQITIGDTTYPLPAPFMVLATQNPLEQEGTYALPEAQVDRFMLKVRVDYPTPDEELAILDAMAKSAPNLSVRPVVSLEELARARGVVDEIYVDDRVKRYVVSIIDATRYPERHGLDLSRVIETGASPRATIGLTMAAKAWAFLSGRAFVTPADVKALAGDVLRHRLALSYEALADGRTPDGVVGEILDHLPVP